MKRKVTVYGCRFPGCNYSAHRPHDRGRHESMTHGMRKVVMPPAEPSANGAAPIEITLSASPSGSGLNIRLALQSAIDNLDHQRKVLAEALEKL